MAKIGRVVHSDIGTPVKKTELFVPLRIKLFVALFVALLPLCVFAVVAGTWFTDGGGSLGVWLLAQSVPVGGISVRLYDVAIAIAALLGAAIGFIAGDTYFVRPTKALLRWTGLMREAQPGHVPISPRLPADETGLLGRELSAIAARILQSGEHEKAAAGDKSIFLTIAAHQLRTPISELTWSIEELLDPSTSADSKEKLLQGLDGLLRRTRLVINHILATANIEEGRFGYVIEQVDILPVFDELIASLKPLAEEHGLALALEHGQLPLVYADKERISLALFDLITNAINYTPKGGRVTVGLKDAGDRVEIFVADTGIGIPEKEMPFIFTKFHRGEGARHMRPNGSGLGLYLVKNILNGHGSEVLVESNDSIGGTRFSFFLNTKAPQ